MLPPTHTHTRALSAPHALLRGRVPWAVQVDPASEDVAVSRYKLATFYYSRDLLQDAGAQAGLGFRI